MTNLYIEVENGVAKNHPAFEDNLIEAFGTIPENWQQFIRVDAPIADNENIVVKELNYAKVNDVWTDVWSMRDLTADEKAAKQQTVIDIFNKREQAENWSAWVFDEVTYTMKPPILRPQQIEGVLVMWCGADNNWKEAPTRPKGEYKFDFFAWNWVAL